MGQRTYLAIDLKSFYASVECVERNLNPLQTNLVVADAARTEKTICLAVSPSLKAYGIPGRARLFEVVERVKQVNAERRRKAPGHIFTGRSSDARELAENPSLELDYIVAPPQMKRYMDCSARVVQTYLQYVAPEDLHVYSIDEVFMDITAYLKTYKMTPRELAGRIIRDVLQRSGITATAGIGTNLYLSKIAMDIVAKKLPADADGVRIAELDEQRYRELLWEHRPLTDFWRVGRGIAKRLESRRIYTMRDIARCSAGSADDFYNPALLYGLLGTNAELLIDHAWGWEPCTMQEIKQYRPDSSSLSSGQVLSTPYDFEKGGLIVREMTDALVLSLVERNLVTDQIVLSVGYDVENLRDPARLAACADTVSTDFYGRKVPKHAHGSVNLGGHTASAKVITAAVTELYGRIVNPALLVRRMTVTANHVLPEAQAAQDAGCEQLDLFTDRAKQEQAEAAHERERRMQETILQIQRKYGKNALLKGMDLQEGATTIERNGQVGGHRA